MKDMKYLDPGIYYGGESIPEGEYYLIYPEDAEAYIEVSIEKADGAFTSVIMTPETPRVHLNVQKHSSFTISHPVGILPGLRPSVLL